MLILLNSLFRCSIDFQNIPSVSFKMFLFVIAITLLKSFSAATSNPFLAILRHPFLVTFRIAMAESSLVLNSIPAYRPSVASLTQIKFNRLSVLLYVIIGLILAYNWNFCLILTATLFGAFGTGIVVVGPLKHALLASSKLQTS